jgi:hypothetical protein
MRQLGSADIPHIDNKFVIASEHCDPKGLLFVGSTTKCLLLALYFRADQQGNRQSSKASGEEAPPKSRAYLSIGDHRTISRNPCEIGAAMAKDRSRILPTND